MVPFINSFCLTLMHSLWQALLLWGLYKGFRLLYSKQSPGFYRNLLFVILASQFVISIFSFIIIYTGSYSETSLNTAPGYTNLYEYTPLLQKLAPWIFSIYCIAVLYKSGQVYLNWKFFRNHCLADIMKPSPEIKVFTALRAMEFGIGKKVSIWYSNRIQSPLTVGFLKPVILLPVALVNNLSTKETEALILHELTHIKNNDYLLNWLLIFSDHAYFFNPFMSIICREISVQRELQCDVQVLRFYSDQLAYADTLLKTARFASQPLVFQMAATGRSEELLRRIRFFTGNNLEFRTNRKAGFTSVFLLMAVVVFTLIGAVTFRQSPLVNTSTTIQLPVNVSSAIPDRLNKEIKAGNTVAASPAGVLINLSDPEDLIKNDHKPATASTKDAVSRTIDTEPITDEPVDIAPMIEENMAFPVAALETENDKEIIIKEEASGSGETISRAYKMTYKDGEWIPKLLWILTEQKPAADSSAMPPQIKSVFPLQQ